ncbi:hypothetical protein [uncultured Fibrella sp.]|uniref:hypothetical protein n=1 Tax=uncultured Fibrella sp. TaxID=1284596 RepID=UPI0035C9AB57
MAVFNTTKKISTAILALFCCVHGIESVAQTSSAQEIQVQNNIATPTNNTLRTFNNSVVGTKGSPFVLSGWAPGELTLEGGKSIKTGLFNYDIINRLVNLKRSAHDSVVYDMATVKQLILQPTGFAPLRYEHVPDLITDEVSLKTDLLRIIQQGTYSLVELPVRTYIKAPTKQAYGGLGEAANEYRDESAYYLIRPDHTVERVKLTKKSLVKALKDKGSALEGFLKANAVDLSNEANAARALAALD